MKEILENSLFFGAAISIGTYILGTWIKKKCNFFLFNPLLLSITMTIAVLLVTGIASATPLVEKVCEHTEQITHMEYGDHHDFSQEELCEISKTYAAIDAMDKLIITTEKDAARLRSLPLDEVITENLYILPIRVEFLQDQQQSFDNYITDYVSKNSRDRIVH